MDPSEEPRAVLPVTLVYAALAAAAIGALTLARPRAATPTPPPRSPPTPRRFAAYWRVIHPGSAIIRREWPRAVRRRAEAR